MECMCAQTGPRLIPSYEGVFREQSQNSCNFKGENALYERLIGGSNPRLCITQDSEPNTLPTELFRHLPHCDTITSIHQSNMLTSSCKVRRVCPQLPISFVTYGLKGSNSGQREATFAIRGHICRSRQGDTCRGAVLCSLRPMSVLCN